MQTLNIAISSAGRRVYLVEWFREALHDLGVHGRVLVTDVDPLAPALSAGDSAAILPPFSDQAYGDALLRLCLDAEIGLLVTLNDYEALRISGQLASELAAHGTVVPLPGADATRAATDKWLLAARLAEAGVSVPRTVLGDEVLRVDDHVRTAGELVVKHRFGSASSGLSFGMSADAQALVMASARTAPDVNGRVQDGTARADFVVVQERVRGQEFGVDVVSDFSGRFVTALARQKLRMRAGETDRALTVCGDQFSGLASRVSTVMGSRGLIDTDVIVDSNGTPYVIDVNPRFGGGYPFSHVAGANIPACYIAWATGVPVADAWLKPSVGATAAKYESITLTE